MMRILKTLGAIATASLLAASGAAYGTATLYITDGITAITVVDGDALDSNGAAGVVTWIGAIGVWTINVSTGVATHSGPNQGIDLNTIDSSTAAGVLTIYFGDTDFTLGPGAHQLTYAENIGGTTHGTVAFSSCVSDANVNAAEPPHGPCSYISPEALLAGPAFGTSRSNTTDVDGLFALTQAIRITHTGRDSTSLDYEIHIPEPGTLALFGISLLGLALGRRRNA